MTIYEKIRLIITCAALACVNNFAIAQYKLDSIQHLPEVLVTENYKDREIRATAPLQILNYKVLSNIAAIQLSDAVKFFSGVTVKDYGGIGGLKTVSVRSLGANHTAISYDGITLTDAQTGQIDLGRFSLDNVNMLSLNSGQSDQIFQPARLFASGSVLNIQTIRPTFQKSRTIHGIASLKMGAWGLFNPSFSIKKKLSDKFALSFSSEWLNSEGQYPYTLYYTPSQSDSSSVEQRQNTDVKNFRLEGSFYAYFSEKQKAECKLYYYQSERGLPGATILYNTKNFSSQRLWDNTLFVQGAYENELSTKWIIKTFAKYNRGYLRYLDPTYLGKDGKEESFYLQQEYYTSTALLYKAFNSLSFSASNDLAWTKLNADAYAALYPTRLTNLTVIAGKYVTEKMLLTSSLLSTLIKENVDTGKSGKNYKQLSPYVSISVKPFSSLDMRLRMFYKNIFRMPSFNDLYYSRIGNPNLLPEKTNQFNLGLTMQFHVNKNIPFISFTADAYHNRVKDKIVAYPTKNIFVWTILNYGKVSVEGLDFTTEAAIRLSENYGIRLNGNYSYQKALNITDINGREYKHQVPYTPRVSGANRIVFETPLCSFAYSMLWSGKRYALNQNYPENRLEAYAEHSMLLSSKYIWNHNTISINIEVLNLLNENYAIVRYFPMPGRSWRATVKYEF